MFHCGTANNFHTFVTPQMTSVFSCGCNRHSSGSFSFADGFAKGFGFGVGRTLGAMFSGFMGRFCSFNSFNIFNSFNQFNTFNSFNLFNPLNSFNSFNTFNPFSSFNLMNTFNPFIGWNNGGLNFRNIWSSNNKKNNTTSPIDNNKKNEEVKKSEKDAENKSATPQKIITQVEEIGYTNNDECPNENVKNVIAKITKDAMNTYLTTGTLKPNQIGVTGCEAIINKYDVSHIYSVTYDKKGEAKKEKIGSIVTIYYTYNDKLYFCKERVKQLPLTKQ